MYCDLDRTVMGMADRCLGATLIDLGRAGGRSGHVIEGRGRAVRISILMVAAVVGLSASVADAQAFNTASATASNSGAVTGASTSTGAVASVSNGPGSAVAFSSAGNGTMTNISTNVANDAGASQQGVSSTTLGGGGTLSGAATTGSGVAFTGATQGDVAVASGITV